MPTFLIIFILAVLALLLWMLLTPSGRRFNAAVEQEGNKQKRELNDARKALGVSVVKLKESPRNPEHEALFKSSLEAIKAKRLFWDNAEVIRKEMLQAMQEGIPQTCNPDLYSFAFKFFTDLNLGKSGLMYAIALDCVENNPGETKPKQFALQVGRWHHGQLRKGTPTIYDEQAIQNDINARSR